MKRATTSIIILAIATLLMGCGSTHRVTQLVEHTRTDTIYLTSHQYDSIYIYQDHSLEFRPNIQSRIANHASLIAIDTLYIKDKSIEYRYKLLRDTVRIVERDSIPYEVTITEVKEISRPLTFYDKLCRTCFWFLVGFSLFWLYTKIRKA